MPRSRWSWARRSDSPSSSAASAPRSVDGVLVAAKPPGPTSHDVVALVRRLSATRRVGHGGTLDPFASGVLPLYLGRATRLVEYHLGDAKRYRATVCFGATSTTDDLDGELTPVEAPSPRREAVVAALEHFRGEIEQVPPAYSAVKIAGRRAYAMARGGEQPALAPRTVTITALDLLEWDDSDPERPIAIIDVRCSAGTYIRALARDLGTAVGSGAHLGALVRTESGGFTLEHAVPLERIRSAAAAGALSDLLLAPDAGLEAFPTIELSADETAAIAKGQFVRPAAPMPALPDGARYRLRGPDGLLVAVAALHDGRLAPEKVLTGGDESTKTEPRPERSPSAVTRPRQPRSDPGRMRVVPGLSGLTPAEGRLFVVVGVFDGLHLGHAYLLEQLREHARRLRARPAVITFDAHPDEILHGSAPSILVDPDERIVRLGEAGVAVTVIQHFDAALRMTPYERFVEMITERTDLAGFLMTPDAAFGHQRGGTPETLAALGSGAGFEVIVVPAFEFRGRQVRSSEIRERIAVGDLDAAATLLGRPFAVVGEPEEGGVAEPADALRTLRFPLPVALPPPGPYRATVGPPLRLSGRGGRDAVAGTIEVVEHGLRVPAAAAGPGADRVRVAFGDT